MISAEFLGDGRTGEAPALSASETWLGRVLASLMEELSRAVSEEVQTRESGDGVTYAGEFPIGPFISVQRGYTGSST